MRSSRPRVRRTLLGDGLHGCLHRQGGIAGAQGVVFVRDGGAKQGHNAIAEHLVHRALEAMHGVHHEVDGRIEELLGGFGIETADEFGGVLEIGKQHRDLFAFAFQGRARGEDLVAEMGRRVGQRRCVRLTCTVRCRCSDWRGQGCSRSRSRPAWCCPGPLPPGAPR